MSPETTRDEAAREQRLTEFFAGDERSNWDRMLAGEHYIADDPRIAEAGRRAIDLMGKFNTAYYQDPEGSQELVRELFGHVGQDVHVRGPIHVDYGLFISVGDRTFINMGLTALDVVAISIGADCQIGPHVQLLAPTHPIAPTPRRDKVEAGEPITICDNVWLGGGVIVCPGVTIGENSVIGSGAVVTKDIPANVVAVGNPARVIKENI